MFTDKEKKLLNAAEYFLSRKKEMDRYVQGEHKWLGDVDQSVQFNPRPWYLETHMVQNTDLGF